MSINLNLTDTDEYTNRVLGVIKEMYGLKNKGEALNKFVHMFGNKFVEPTIKEEFIKEVIDSCDKHMKKHPKRRMTLKQLKNI